MTIAPPPNWYPTPDPKRTGELQWWDGTQWVQHFITDFSGTDVQKLSKNDAREEVLRLQQIVLEKERLVNEHGLRSAEDFEMWRDEQSQTVAAQQREIEAQLDQLRLKREEAEREATRIVDSGQREAQKRITVAEAQAAELMKPARKLEEQRAKLRDEISGLQKDVVDLSQMRELQDVGYFDYEHPAEASTTLATELEGVRLKIKTMLRENRASTAAPNFTFNNSVAQGRKFVNALTKLLLRAYNAEAENAIKTTKAGNLSTAQARLSKAADQIAKHGEMIDMRITHEFHRLRLKEIELASRHMQALQREKELERERKAELREQRKVEQELRKEQERLEKEQAHYRSTLAALESNGDTEGAERMRAKLEDVERAINDVDYRAANIRAGYVYVISNVGSFGEDVVKIGMTRRLEPMDRVRELGDASVPFNFDVHALFFADDAVAVESMLHREFSQQRINRVNLRREYFRVTPQDVLDKLKEQRVEVLEFTMQPEAEEFRKSQAWRGEPDTAE